MSTGGYAGIRSILMFGAGWGVIFSFPMFFDVWGTSRFKCGVNWCELDVDAMRIF